jgi:hypothetical protein
MHVCRTFARAMRILAAVRAMYSSARPSIGLATGEAAGFVLVQPGTIAADFKRQGFAAVPRR